MSQKVSSHKGQLILWKRHDDLCGVDVCSRDSQTWSQKVIKSLCWDVIDHGDIQPVSSCFSLRLWAQDECVNSTKLTSQLI